MPRLSLWNSGRKGADYNFTDRIISGHFFASGTAVYVHKYLGPHDQTDPSTLPPGTPAAQLNERSIQDVLFLENRDRKYDTNVYELRGCYSVADNDFDLRQFGLFLTGDTLFLEFHLNDMIAMIGRKLMAGDVLELPHQRDDALLDPNAPAINKFYSVTDANRASGGYSANWWPHIWRVKIEPMTDSQKYADILDQQAENPFGLDQGRLGDLISDVGIQMGVNEAVVAAAKENVKARNFETRHFWVMPGEGGADGKQNPWIYAGDGAPPNGLPCTSGNRYPPTPVEGDYHLRTDYDPQALFQFHSGVWRLQELDYRRSEWNVAHRLLEGFINNDRITVFDNGTTLPEKQPLYKAVKPQADF